MIWMWRASSNRSKDSICSSKLNKHNWNYSILIFSHFEQTSFRTTTHVQTKGIRSSLSLWFGKCFAHIFRYCYCRAQYSSLQKVDGSPSAVYKRKRPHSIAQDIVRFGFVRLARGMDTSSYFILYEQEIKSQPGSECEQRINVVRKSIKVINFIIKLMCVRGLVCGTLHNGRGCELRQHLMKHVVVFCCAIWHCWHLISVIKCSKAWFFSAALALQFRSCTFSCSTTLKSELYSLL